MLHKSAWGGIYSIFLFFFQLGGRNLTTVLGPKLALFALQGGINQATTLNMMERLNLLGCSQLPPSLSTHSSSFWRAEAEGGAGVTLVCH